MGDKYIIRIPKFIRDGMSKWEIPDDFRKTVDDRLRHDLATDPANKLVRVIGPNGERPNVFAFTVPEPPTPKSTCIFAFHFIYSHDEKSLQMLEYEYQPYDPDIDDSGTPVM